MNWANNAEAFERDIARTAEVINAADAVFVGAGAGLSTAIYMVALRGCRKSPSQGERQPEDTDAHSGKEEPRA